MLALKRRVKNFALKVIRQPKSRLVAIFARLIKQQVESQKGDRKILSLRKRLRNYGFHRAASRDLLAIVERRPNNSFGRSAAWELVHFYLDSADASNASKLQRCLEVIERGARQPEERRKFAIASAEANLQLGQETAAKAILEDELRRGAHVDVLLALANFQRRPDDKLPLLNRVFQLRGLTPITLIAADQLPAFDRLQGEPSKDDAAMSAAQESLVTIIVPAYNSAQTIPTALRSILGQTWKNIECIVVDDCSTDDTRATVQQFVDRDPRVRLLTLERNSGPYVARNAALDVARGDCITCHDADDWSHPQKIERQVRKLLASKGAMATLSTQARATSELEFVRRGRPAEIAFENISSLMFRREALSALGYWDSVRFSADGEFIRRLKKTFGSKSVVQMGEVLSFQRSSNTSLTADPAFGYSGYLTGARQSYFNTSSDYHKAGKSLRYPFPMAKRPFCAPAPMLRKQSLEGTRHYDVVIGSDFRLAGGSTLSSIEEIKAQHAAGLRTAIFQMCRYDFDAFRSMNAKVMKLVEDGCADLIVYGENVTTDILLLRYPPILQEVQQYIPSVRTKNIKVIVNQPPMSDYSRSGVVRYTIPECVKNAKAYFGADSVWHPIGPIVRDALIEHHSHWLPSYDLSSEDWHNIVDFRDWRRPQGHKLSSPPRIGRHSRDHDMKWPNDRDVLLSIYPASPDVEVWVLGGANTPRSIIGTLPANWRVFPFDGISPREFLAQLDVFVYYTHDHWVESFGRVIIEAMAAGVPAVLPPQYKGLFDKAALYAPPSKVQSVVQRLINDPALYAKQVNAAFEHIEAQFGYSMHIDRVRAAQLRNLIA